MSDSADVEFEHLQPGDVFVRRDGRKCMKVNLAGWHTAVEFGTGRLAETLMAYEVVRPLPSESPQRRDDNDT